MKKLILCLALYCGMNIFCAQAEARKPDRHYFRNFVQRDGTRLVLEGKPFYFNAANNDHLYYSSHFMIDDILEDAKGLGLTAFRIWASSEGRNSWKDGYCFQPEPGQYHEATFKNMDYIIAKAKEKGIRLILPFVNNWDDGYGGMPQYVKWCLGDPKDWSGKTALTFDLYNAGDAAVVDVAIRTGSEWTWHESLPTDLVSGWNHISYDLTAYKWKTKASNWEYTSQIGNLNQVQTFGIGIFGYAHPGAAYIDNIKFDSVLSDGLEKIDGWYATDYSYATGVELSTDYATEGTHSLKMTYSYSYGEYNKAFAEKQPQLEKDNFYTNAACKQLYKNYIKYFLNRKNTITGRAYKDDPTILMWELANEPRCESDPSGDTLRAWIDEMAGYIKSIDPHHMVSTGEEGWYNIPGTPDWDWRHDGRLGADFIRNNQSPYIDICSFHLYPEGYGLSDQMALDWIEEHLNDAHNVVAKPVWLGEFGITADRKATLFYNFDSGAQGWSIDWNYKQGPIQAESPSRDNNGAIYYTADIDETNTSCGGRIVYPDFVDYSGYDYLSGWVYIPSGAPTDLTIEMYVHTGPDWNWASGRNVPLVPGTWTQARLTKSQIEGWGADISKVRGLGIQIKRGNTNYSGDVYYDAVGANLKEIYDAAYQLSRRNQLYESWFNLLNAKDSHGAGFWQLLAHRDDGTLFPDYWNWGVYYPEDQRTSEIIQYFSALMKNKCAPVPTPKIYLNINPAVVKPGAPFKLTVTAQSSVPLDSMWWFVKNNTSSDIPGTIDGVAGNLNLDHYFDAAKGITNYTRTMNVTINNPGNYQIKANAKDILAQTTSHAAQIIVKTTHHTRRIRKTRSPR